MSFLWQSIRRVQFGEHVPVGEGKWAAFSKCRLPVLSENSIRFRCAQILVLPLHRHSAPRPRALLLQ